jgi:ferredoxin
MIPTGSIERVEVMDDLVIDKDRTPEWSHELSDYTIYAPQRKGDVVVFDVLTNVNQVVLHYANSVKPPKEVFFPQTETLFSYEKTPELSVKTPEYKQGKVLLFGVRPCDARSFLILDKLFYWGEEDNLYKKRRDNTVIIGLACNAPHHNCFCTSVGGHPSSKEGMDVLLTDLGDRYYVEILTEKGEDIIKKPDTLFSKATPEDARLRDEIIKEAEENITKHVNIEGVSEKLDELFESDYWDEESKTCVGCGICTFLCPTCHCFDITDEDFGNSGRRIRTWDTCMVPEYTVHASGYNPRPGKKYRTRNRIYHKYRYFPERFDVIACVGCGRCISKCPVGRDITDTITDVKEVEK